MVMYMYVSNTYSKILKKCIKIVLGKVAVYSNKNIILFELYGAYTFFIII